MRLKAFYENPRAPQLPGRIRIRRKSPRRKGDAAAQPRVWSLLLPPQYPADRR